VSPAYLFVYGTLRRGSPNRFAQLLESQARFIGNARVVGRLYSFGKYPGAIRSDLPGEWVRGEVFLLKAPARILQALDEYEGPKYERVAVPVELASGKHIESWVYFYGSKRVTGRIGSGEWTRRG